ncbi:hypothetical protein ACQBAU_08375 [Propionibacteriaceae bacterium Y2011]|uniref:hypothetical protein n=1 Tax=Microlunatus sp. Y2014 TaxID=3418488 RepID=UPI003B4FF7A2
MSQPQQPYPPQQQPGQPGPYGQQPGQPQPGQLPADAAFLKMHVQGSVLTNNMVPPTLYLDGAPTKLPQSGETVIPVPPGQHHLKVESQWMRTFGRAEMTVQVSPAQQLDVYYAAPLHQFTDGAIGLEPQKKKGVGFLIGLFAVLFLMILAVVLLPILFS